MSVYQLLSVSVCEYVFRFQLAHAEEMFVGETSSVTPVGALCEKFKDIGQRLLNHYVRIQGQVISQVTLTAKIQW